MNDEWRHGFCCHPKFPGENNNWTFTDSLLVHFSWIAPDMKCREPDKRLRETEDLRLFSQNPYCAHFFLCAKEEPNLSRSLCRHFWREAGDTLDCDWKWSRTNASAFPLCLCELSEKFIMLGLICFALLCFTLRCFLLQCKMLRYIVKLLSYS